MGNTYILDDGIKILKDMSYYDVYGNLKLLVICINLSIFIIYENDQSQCV